MGGGARHVACYVICTESVERLTAPIPFRYILYGIGNGYRASAFADADAGSAFCDLAVRLRAWGIAIAHRGLHDFAPDGTSRTIHKSQRTPDEARCNGARRDERRASAERSPFSCDELDTCVMTHVCRLPCSCVISLHKPLSRSLHSVCGISLSARHPTPFVVAPPLSTRQHCLWPSAPPAPSPHTAVRGQVHPPL